MSDSQLPTEVELAYEVMPCNALRVAQEPGKAPHPCRYFRKWGFYHSYDYPQVGPPQQGKVVNLPQYLYAGRAPLVPEMVSGCRKAPIMAVGINPNLTGWNPDNYNVIYPWFDDYKQFAHYFRYRQTQKLDIPKPKFLQYPNANQGPLTGAHPPEPNTTGVEVPLDGHGHHTIPAEPLDVTMYKNYESLLADLAQTMNWQNHQLSLGEDVSYGNMVACPSAKWLNAQDPDNPTMPPMRPDEQRGIVHECFHVRRYFLRQLFQSLPAVLMVFSQSTTDAFIGEMAGRFTAGDPKVGDKIDDLIQRTVRLKYGTANNGSTLEARVIFSPHITGNPAKYAAARKRILDQLVEEAQAGRIEFNPQTSHLRRPAGSCVFCTMLTIGPCDYVEEIKPLKTTPQLLAAASPAAEIKTDKEEQQRLLGEFLAAGWPLAEADAELLAASPTDPAIPATADADKGWLLSGNPRGG